MQRYSLVVAPEIRTQLTPMMSKSRYTLIPDSFISPNSNIKLGIKLTNNTNGELSSNIPSLSMHI